jgi:hypothetical protein
MAFYDSLRGSAHGESSPQAKRTSGSADKIRRGQAKQRPTNKAENTAKGEEKQDEPKRLDRGSESK